MIDLGDRINARLQEALFWCYALFLAGFFILPEAPDHYKLYYLLVFLPTLMLWRKITRLHARNALFLFVVAYSAYMLVSIGWSDNLTLPAAAQVAWHSILAFSFVAATGLLASEYPNRYDLLLHRLVWLAGIAGAASILAFYSEHAFPMTRLQPPLSRMDNAVLASYSYGIFCLLAVHYLVNSVTSRDKLLNVLFVILLLATILLTQSRTVLLALGIGFVILLGLRGMVVVSVLAVGVSVVLIVNPDLWQQQLTRGLSFRPAIWQAVVEQATEHWYFGRGYLTDTTIQVNGEGVVHAHAHSAYLATLRDGGLFGLALLFAMLSVAVYWAVKLAQGGERLYLGLLAYAMVCVISDIDRLLSRPKEHWLFFWLPVALVMAVYSNRWLVVKEVRQADSA
ncbi:MAG: O-antigen ligase family protein [Pseudomonadales bacterium]